MYFGALKTVLPTSLKMKNSIEPIIRVDHLSKRYRIGGQETYTSLRDSLAAAARARSNDGAMARIQPGQFGHSTT